MTSKPITGARFLGECMIVAGLIAFAAWLGCGCTPAGKALLERTLLSAADLALKLGAEAAEKWIEDELGTSGGEEP